MLSSRSLCALALSIAQVAAFKDTSPFFIFSNTAIPPTQLTDSTITRAETVLSSLTSIVKSCEWDTYVVVSQPEVEPRDFRVDSSPRMRRWAQGNSDIIKSSVILPEVLGEIDEEQIAAQLERQCRARIEEVDASTGFAPISDGLKRVLKIPLPAPPPSTVMEAPERRFKLRENDAFLSALLSQHADQRYILIYTTTPYSPGVHHDEEHHNLHLYDNDDPFHQGLHMDLKRDFGERQSKNASLPLFETYQYLNPALFMGILVSVALFLILYVAVSGVAGLEVSYFSFSKEMGPAAQKKQQ